MCVPWICQCASNGAKALRNQYGCHERCELCGADGKLYLLQCNPCHCGRQLWVMARMHGSILVAENGRTIGKIIKIMASRLAPLALICLCRAGVSFGEPS